MRDNVDKVFALCLAVMFAGIAAVIAAWMNAISSSATYSPGDSVLAMSGMGMVALGFLVAVSTAVIEEITRAFRK